MAGIRTRADEETVQTTNTKEAVKTVVVRITDWSKVQFFLAPPHLNWDLRFFSVQIQDTYLR